MTIDLHVLKCMKMNPVFHGLRLDAYGKERSWTCKKIKRWGSCRH